MKLNINNQFISIASIIAIFSIAFAIADLFFIHHITVFYFHWIALLLLAATIFLPISHYRFEILATLNRKKIYSNIMLFQLFLLGTFYGIGHLFGLHTVHQSLLSNADLGLLPWCFMLIIGIGMGYTTYTKKRDCSATTLIETFIPLRVGGQSWSLLQFFLRQAVNSAVGLTLGLISLSVYYAIVGQFEFFSLRSVLLSFFLMILFLLKPFYRIVKIITNSRYYLWLNLPCFALILGLILGALGYALSATAILPVTPPAALQTILAKLTPGDIAILFGNSWWLCWSVLGGIYIVRTARGLKVQEIIIITLLLPTLLSLLLTYTSLNTLTTQPWNILIGTLSTLGLLKLILSKDMLPCYVLSYFPINPHPKQRSHQLMFKKSIKLMLVALVFSFPMGLSVFTFFSLAAATPLLLLSVFFFISYVRLK